MSLGGFIDYVILIGLIFIFVLFNVASGMNWSSTILVLPIVGVIVLLLLRDSDIDGLKNITLLHLYVILFGIFCLLSVLWATNLDLALARSMSLFNRFGVLFILCWYCYKKNAIKNLLQIIMFSNYIVMLIVIWFYGWETVIMLLNLNIRVDNDLLNANTLGMGAAYSFLIGLYYAYYEKKIWYLIIMLPTIAMVAFSGSKKAAIILVVGTLLLVIFKDLYKGNFQKNIWKIIMSTFVVLVIFFIMFNLSIFDNLTDRFSMLMNMFNNEYSDSSTEERYAMMLLGLDIFEAHPILGVGIDNALLYNVPRYDYLHSNPFELLADIGIVGVCVYYWIYILIAYRFWKYRDFSSKEYIISFTLFCLVLPMNVAYVTYSEMTTYLYLALFYHESRLLKRAGRL